MAQSDTTRDLVRALKSPRMTFQNGLMSTPNNNINGFVSDLVNSEVEKSTGAVIRRSGSFCLINPPTYKEWVVYVSIDVSGAEIVLLIDYSGAFYVVSDMYPEILFKLNKSGFTKIYYPDVKDYSYEVRFDRGTNYMYNDRTDSITVTNEFGDSITIFKKGSIRFLENSGTQESYHPRERRDFDDLNPTDPACFIPIKYSRKKKLNSFNLIDAPDKTYDYVRRNIPRINSIKGSVSVAQVDSLGRIGRKSQSIFLNKYGEYYVSMIPAYNLRDEIMERLGLILFNEEFPDNPNYTEWYVEREAGTRSVKYSATAGIPPVIGFYAVEGVTDATITLTGGGASLSVSTSGNDVEVTFIPSSDTVNSLVSAINSDAAASLIMTAVALGSGTEHIPTLAQTPLSQDLSVEAFKMVCEDQDYNFQQTSFKELGEVPEYFTCTFGIHPDTPEHPLGKYMRATMWLDYQAVSSAAARTVVMDNIGCLMKAVNINFMRFPHSATAISNNFEIIKSSNNEFLVAGDVDFAGAEMVQGVFDENHFSEMAMYIIGAEYIDDLPLKYGFDNHVSDSGSQVVYWLYDSSADSEPSAKTGILFDVLIALPSTYIKDMKTAICLQDVSGNPLESTIRTYNFSSLMTAQIPFIVDTAFGISKPTGFFPAQWALRVPNNENLYVGLRNMGYDCWTAKRGLRVDTIINLDKDYYDMNLDGDVIVAPGQESSITDDLLRNFDIICLQADYDEWFKNGTRFAVINDDSVVAVSQRCFASSNDLVPVYSQSHTDSGTRQINYQTEIDMIGYMPICAVENIYLRGFPFVGSTLQKEAEYIKDIVETASNIFMLENGVIWIGKNNEMLIFDFSVQLDSSINKIAKFNNGVVAFMAHDIKYVDNRGKIFPIHNLNSFGNVDVVVAKHMPNNNVYAVTSQGEIMMISIKYTEENIQYYQADNMSIRIPDIIFGSNTDIAFSNETIWFSRDNDVYGLTPEGWTKVNTFGDNKIAGIFTYRDELCVIFNNNPLMLGRVKLTYGDLSSEVVG